MSIELKKEIVNYIFNLFGIFKNESILDYAVDKKLIFESEGKSYHNAMWSGEITSEGSKIQFLAAELTEDIPDIVLIIWLENSYPYVLRMSKEEGDAGDFLVLTRDEDVDINNKWIEVPVINQAKVLIAVESIFDTFMGWNKNNNIDVVYSYLISFLNYESEQNV